mgnify:CR=1 FL=1
MEDESLDVAGTEDVDEPGDAAETADDVSEPELGRVLRLPDIQEKFRSQGLSTMPGTPEQFAALLQSESTRYSKVVREANIKRYESTEPGRRSDTLKRLKAEKARLDREIGKIDDETEKIDRKLGNPQFVAKALKPARKAPIKRGTDLVQPTPARGR